MVGSQVFRFVAPEGWVSDVEAGSEEQLPVVFYPKGKNWKSSGAKIYVRVCFKDSRSFPKMVQDDKQSFEEGVAEYHETLNKTDHLANGLPYIQKSITYKPLIETDSPFSIVASNTIHERIAYLDASDKLVIVLVLTADGAHQLTSGLPAFQKVLLSFQ